MSEKTRATAVSLPRRKGAPNSEVRLKLVQLARTILQNEGSAAVTTGRLAKEVGLGRHIIHYYFGTIDELLVEVIRGAGDEIWREYEVLLAEGNPLRVIWQPSAPAAPIAREFVALAGRSEIVRIEVERYTKRIRSMLTQALERYLREKGLSPNVPPGAIVLTVLSISQALSSEAALGVFDAHRETEALVSGWIDAFEARGEWPMGVP